MSRLQILRYPDPRLYKKAAPVERVDDEVRELVRNMAQTMYEAPGVGLAATQVDVHRRVIVIDVSETKDDLLVLINPEIVERDGQTTILDFKTSAVDDQRAAQQRAQESLQLDVYALAFLETRGRLPERVELHFLESGLVGGRRPTLEEAQATKALIRDLSAAIRRREFPARPSWLACGQCAFRDICPHTARQPEAASASDAA